MTLSQGDGEIGPATSEHDCGLAGTDQRHVVAGLPDVVDVVKAGRCVATGHGGRRAVHHPLDGAIHLNLTSASSPKQSLDTRRREGESDRAAVRRVRQRAVRRAASPRAARKRPQSGYAGLLIGDGNGSLSLSRLADSEPSITKLRGGLKQGCLRSPTADCASACRSTNHSTSSRANGLGSPAAPHAFVGGSQSSCVASPANSSACGPYVPFGSPGCRASVVRPMNINASSLQSSLGVVASLSAFVAAIVAAFWAYTKYVVERALFPKVQFWPECRDLGTRGDNVLFEVALHLKNVGDSTLVATDVRLDILYLDKHDNLELSIDPTQSARFGRVIFKRSLNKDLLERAGVPAVSERRPRAVETLTRRPRGFSVVPYDTFVGAQVDQVYTFVTAVPSSATHVLVWSSFQYARRLSPLQNAILWLNRSVGLIPAQRLEHMSEAHTTESVFRPGSASAMRALDAGASPSPGELCE